MQTIAGSQHPAAAEFQHRPRFAMETKRQLDVLDRQLAENEYIAGKDCTIADIAIFPWYGGLAKGWIYGDSATFLSVQDTRTCSAGPTSCSNALPQARPHGQSHQGRSGKPVARTP